MSGYGIDIDVTGAAESDAMLQELRNTLADRRQLHAELAVTATEFTRQYLRGLNRHATAQRLGASPTNHHERNANSLEADSDEKAAIIRIPRRTGLGRAFGPVTIRPLAPRKFIVIPETAETYGRQPSEWPEETFDFAVILTHRGAAPVLKWAATGGAHKKGDIAFWLRTSVEQKQDRTLLPGDDAYQELGRRVTVAHIANRLNQTAA